MLTDADSEILVLNRNHQISQGALFVLSLPDRRFGTESENSDSRPVNECAFVSVVQRKYDELIDAMPVHVKIARAGQMYQWY